MANGWGGADPTDTGDANAYELGTEYVANQTITVSAVRVWAPADAVTVTNRKGHLWSTAGVLLATVSLADALPTGWSTYNLGTPLVVNAAEHVVVSYATGGNYGGVSHALDSAVTSADMAVTAVAGSSGAHGNGSFTTSPNTFPTSASGANFFYGIDIVYTIGSSGNQPPVINLFQVTTVGAVATAALSATDPDNDLTGALYGFDWGDGHQSVGLSTGSATHTYTASRDYPVLGWVTDAGGLSTYAVAIADVTLPDPSIVTPNFTALMNALETQLRASGYFGTVNPYQAAKNAPEPGMTVDFWVDEIRPLPDQSGLNCTTGVLVVLERIYTTLQQQPSDAIEPEVLTATSAMIGAYSGDFTLGGLVRNVDLLGMSGSALSAKAGYVTRDGLTLRAMTITVPLIIGDIWGQVADD